MPRSHPSSSLPSHLPVDKIRERFERALADGPVVLTAPTGSGKSTRVPTWCAEQQRTVVIEPRRVACRALADIVAKSQGCTLGHEVGYIVRNERRARRDTRLSFMTPGIALRMLASGSLQDARIIVDEFHERTMELDLLVALLKRQGHAAVIMSATLDAERLGRWFDATVVEAEGRLYPVDITHAGGVPAPSPRQLRERVVQEVRQVMATRDGDVLVFLPGRGEIDDVVHSLRAAHITAVPLHGRLSLQQQSQALQPGDSPRVIVSTNVAETSLTVPGIRTVIDAGLVRRTRYHRGRGYLTMLPIALDAANQRAGRAGRLGPGHCIRLWESDRTLADMTPPELHRESLVPLVLGAAACGEDARRLDFPDAPKAFALEDALHDLQELGGVDASGRVTDRGRQLFGLPVDAHLGRLIVEAQSGQCLQDAIDLVAALTTSRRLFVRQVEEEDDLGAPWRCDATAHILAVRHGEPGRHGLDRLALEQARKVAARLRDAFDLSESPRDVDRRALADAALAAWPRCARVARRRKRQVAWAHGGTEARLASESRIDEASSDALISFDARALTDRRGQRELLITVAMPVELRWLAEAGRGDERVADIVVEDGVLYASLERRYAGRVLATRRTSPTGEHAVEAVAQLIERGRWGGRAHERSRDLFEQWRLAHKVGLTENLPWDREWVHGTWLRACLAELGIAAGDDLALLSPDDVCPDPLPDHLASQLARSYPRRLDIGELAFELDYDVAKREATLRRVRGPKGRVPPLHYLPRLPGWRLVIREASNVRELRPRR